MLVYDLHQHGVGEGGGGERCLKWGGGGDVVGFIKESFQQHLEIGSG